MTQDEFDQLTKLPSPAKDFKHMNSVWHLLYNTETKRPLLCTTIYATINGIAKREIKAEPWYTMGARTNISGKLQYNADFKTSRCWEYVWDTETRELVYQPDGLGLEDKFHHMLTVRKAATLDKLTGVINSYRRPFQRQYFDQEAVHQWKFEEAREILKLPTNVEVNVDDYKFVSDYAAHIKVDIRVAAQEIVDRNNFQKEAYRTSEMLKMQYTDAIYNETTFEGIGAIWEELTKAHMRYFRP